MRSIRRNAMKLAVMLLLAATLFGGAGMASAASLPTSPCALDTDTATATCELWATTGTATLFGSTTVNTWGYSTTSTPGSATLPGPILTVRQGDTVTVTLHNGLAENTALFFQGQSMIPDTTGVAAGDTATYTFTASKPGTFLYEAGLIPGKQHQSAMGMYGALVVKPADGTAYGTPGTTFNEETALVLSEFDTALATSPTTFDMRNYAPKYFLVNGKAYPDTDLLINQISVTAGNKVLLRYVNAGLQSHAMSTLGISQSAIAMDGHALAHPHTMVAETIATGQTLDALVTIPAGTANGTKFAVYDANLMLRNANAPGFGGMLTFLTVGPTASPADTGPFVSLPSLLPNPTNGSVDVTVGATISDAGTLTVNNITSAEFYIDSTAGSPTTMTGSFGLPTVSVTGNIPTATLTNLTSGNHTIYIRGQDSAGNWSPFLSITLNLDKTGPATSGLSLTPNPSSGAVSVALAATGNDTASGNNYVTAAEYWVDAGAHTAMTASGSASPIRNFTASIPAGLSMGSHVVSVRSQDLFGNWGAVATITLQVTDTAAPTTSNVLASPNPNNGNQGFNTSVPAVRVTADFSDVLTGGSNIAAAEGFIDTVGTTGTGFVFIATDGSFNSPSESGYSDIPLAVIGALSNGSHTIYVHAKDAAGNWGTMSTTILVINKSLYFSTSGTTNPPGVGGTADDADIYLWNGSAFSRVIDASAAPYSLPASGGGNANVDGFDRVDANHFYMSFTGQVSVPGIGNVQDEDIVYYNAGTWSLYYDGSVNGVTANVDAISIVGGNLYFSLSTTTTPPGAGGTGDAADIYRWNGGSSYTRVVDASVIIVPGGSNVDGLVWVDTTHFYLSFSTDTTLTGPGAIQDEDVVYYNAGTWSVYFDGTGKGLTNNNQDVDAFDIP